MALDASHSSVGSSRSNSSFESRDAQISQSLNRRIDALLEATALNYENLQGLIGECRTEAMRGSVAHQVALEILVPMSVEHLPMPASPVKNDIEKNAQAFFQGWLNPFASDSDVSSKTPLIQKVMQAYDESLIEQSVAESLIDNIANFNTSASDSVGSHSPLVNTCYFDTALNILTKNSTLSHLIESATPESDQWQQIQALLNNLARSTQLSDSSRDYVQLHQLLTAQLVPRAGATAQEGQHDANELIGSILQGVGVETQVGVELGDIEATEQPSVSIDVRAQDIATFYDTTVRLSQENNNHSLAGVCIHTGQVETSANGVSSNFGHYYSLVKNEESQGWDLFSYTQRLGSFDQQGIDQVLGQLANHPVFAQANYSGVYA